MDKLTESIFPQPLAGIILILAGFIFSFITGQEKAYELYKKDKRKRIMPVVIVILQYALVLFCSVFIVILSFKNPDWINNVVNIIITFFIFGFFIVVMFIIKFLTQKFYKNKYLEEERQNRMISEINLIMTEFSNNNNNNNNNPPINPQPEPDETELSEEDEEFLLHMKNKYLKGD